MSDQTRRTKIGLALSGGGFRAAFFHVGVLARLAEIGVLRRVEVISTVSGGSIVGAAYYLRLKRLLETRDLDGLTDENYRELVVDVGAGLRSAVRKNIRTRVFANPLKNFRMASPKYSRSDRIGDLYDRYLYKEAWGATRPRKRWGVETQVEMRELPIRLGGDQIGFDLGDHNARYDTKVPLLLINATTLNSGHNWRFEATRMGEPFPQDEDLRRVVEDVDKNMRLEQAYFTPTPGRPSIPKAQLDFPLALAVAASACVPGVFHPLSISDLYEGIRVQLVDGGVQDNQGLRGLTDEGCTDLVISDASGQLSDEKKPSTRIPGVAGRTMSISGDRIRDEQLANAYASSHAVALMHLRKGLRGRAIPPLPAPADGIPEREGTVDCSSFGIDPTVQEALSQVRTDLDFFSDIEAFSLALDGYRMSAYELRERGFEQPASGFPSADASRWSFGVVASLIEQPTDKYLGQLRGAKRRFFRPLALLPGSVVWLLVAAVLVGLARLLVGNWDVVADALDGSWHVYTVLSVVVLGGAIAAAYMATGVRLPPLRWPVDFLAGTILPFVLAPFLAVWSWLNMAAAPLARCFGRAPKP